MKRIRLLSALMIFVFVLSSCSHKDAAGSDKLPENTTFSDKMPEDTTLEYWLTQDVSAVDFSKYIEIGGCFGCSRYYGTGYEPVKDENGYLTDPEHYVIYEISAYPDYADGGSYITYMRITDPSVLVYGLTVACSFDDFDKTFKDMNYDITIDQNQYHTAHKAAKGNIHFYLDDEDGHRTLSIQAEISNRDHIIF